jgi:flagellar L-ring protein precursor FlgH
MKNLKFLVLPLVISMFSGCATVSQKWKQLIGSDTPQTAAKVETPKSDDLKYSDQQDAPIQENKRYHRMTREQFEKEGLTDETGSLWSGDGQGSYLFSANMVRIPGDSVNITLDGEPKKQLTQKAAVLAQLMKKANRAIASVPGTPAPAVGPDGQPVAAGAAAPATPAPSIADKKDEKEEDAKDLFTVANIPSRIVERVPDGSYRVRGNQTFMIGKDEFRVIASGLVKSGDISDEGVAASKMMDPKFDIVSMKRSSEKMTENR